jgi:hypothetical protein
MRTILLALLLMLLGVSNSEAQDRRSATWGSNAQKQFEINIRNADPAIRATAFENAIVLATLHGGVIDLERLERVTISHHRAEQDHRVRIAALAVLHWLNTPSSQAYRLTLEAGAVLEATEVYLDVVTRYLRGVPTAIGGVDMY